MSHNAVDSDLPLVLQVGFSGSRNFLPSGKEMRVDRTAFEQQIEAYLVKRLEGLPRELGVAKHKFICGICQLAAGGDTLFVQACRKIGAPLRIFLPQPQDVFFRDTGNEADFTPEQRAAGEAILASPEIAQIRVIGEATGRSARFQAVNHEIARESDVSICLVRANAEFNQGGTLEFLAHARVRRRPVLKIVVTEEEGRPAFADEWIDKDQFVAPAVPNSLTHATHEKTAPACEIPSIGAYLARLRADCHDGANRYRDRFTAFANIIIWTHIAATALALLVLTLPHENFEILLAILLSIELACLATGFGAHWLMHKLHLAKNWAQQRLVLQLASSVDSVKNNHVPLDFLFQLPMPSVFRPLLRTLNILHLRDTRKTSAEGAVDWETKRNQYLTERVQDQLGYYDHKLVQARRKLRFFHYAFTIFSALAICATGVKLGISWPSSHSKDSKATHAVAVQGSKGHEDPHDHTSTKIPTGGEAATPHDGAHEAKAPQNDTATGKSSESESHGSGKTDPVTTILGALAVLLPVLAVGMMSIAAAHDLEGRLHTYDEMVGFLNSQSNALSAASSNEDFVHLLVETESRLLGETVNWLSRRSFTGVA